MHTRPTTGSGLNARWQLALALTALTAFLIFPIVATGYWIRVVTSALMFATMAQACNIITGYAGYAALGNVVFFGVGAYGTAILMNHYHMAFLPALVVGGGAVAAAYAALLGIPILRTKGHYFVMATIGLMEATREVVLNLKWTGGGHGLNMPIPDLAPPTLYSFFYYYMLTILLLCTLTVWFISRHRFGYGLRAIRANEEAASVMGVNTLYYKVIGWTISTFFTGMAGGVYAYWTTFIEPKDVFSVVVSVKFFVMMMLGGMGTVLGPIIGAFFVELLGEILWGSFTELHRGILGLLIVVIVLIVPRGMVQFMREGTMIKTIITSLRKGRA